jgi:hypothetical protein
MDTPVIGDGGATAAAAEFIRSIDFTVAFSIACATLYTSDGEKSCVSIV